MNTPVPPLSAGYLRAVAMTTLITTIFAAVWGLNGSFAIPGFVRILCIILVLLVTAVLFSMAFMFTRAVPESPNTDTNTANPFRNRLYNFAVIAQVVAILLVSRLLTATGYPNAIISAVASIVGLHFFALIPVFHSWRFAAVGGAMMLLGAGSLLLAPVVTISTTGETLELRTAAVGLGCAIILWAGVVPLVASTQRQVSRMAK